MSEEQTLALPAKHRNNDFQYVYQRYGDSKLTMQGNLPITTSISFSFGYPMQVPKYETIHSD